MLFFDNSCSGNHGRQLVADFVNGLGEKLFRHNRPGGTAGGQGKCLFSGGHLLHIMLCLGHTAHIRADCRLVHIRKAQLLQRRFEHIGSYPGAELTRKGGSYLGDNLPP